MRFFAVHVCFVACTITTLPRVTVLYVLKTFIGITTHINHTFTTSSSVGSQDPEQKASYTFHISGSGHPHPQDLLSRLNCSLMINEANERSLSYGEDIHRKLGNVLRDTNGIDTDEWPDVISKSSGKVRDVFDCGENLVIITTDRQSAFDRNLAAVPYKGQVLNMLSAWWFEQSRHIVPNAFVVSPHPNVTIARKCTVFPIEFVVRGYITGSTATSMWTNYANGVRSYCGHTLPEGLKKNQKLSRVIITPTTKSDEHDALTSADEIVAEGVMSQGQWDTCAHYALSLFTLGQELCAQRGLILVDTKYEFGMDVRDGAIRLVDELHTPDSSRFWVTSSYEQRCAAGEDPESVDKDVLRRWYVAHCDPYDTALPLPEPPAALIVELSRRYISVYEALTGERLDLSARATTAEAAIITAVAEYFAAAAR